MFAARVGVRVVRNSLSKITPADRLSLLRRFLLTPQPNYMTLLHEMLPCGCVLDARDIVLLAAVARSRRVGAIKMLLDRGVVTPSTVTLLACAMACEGNAEALAGLLDSLGHALSWTDVCMAAIGAWTEINFTFRHALHTMGLSGLDPRPEVVRCVAEKMQLDALDSAAWRRLVRLLAPSEGAARGAADLAARLAARAGGDAARESLLGTLAELRPAGGIVMRAYATAVLVSLREPELFGPDAWVSYEPPAVTAGYSLWRATNDAPSMSREEREARAESFYLSATAGRCCVYMWCSYAEMRGPPPPDPDDEWQRIQNEQYDREQAERDAELK